MNDILNSALVWAAQEPAPKAPPAETGPFGIPYEIIYMMIAIFFVFYFLVIRPQKNEQRNREKMIDTLAKGDQVVTVGGIHGTVESYDREKGIVSVTIAPKINVRFSRTAIATVSAKKGKGKDDETEGKSE